MTWIAISVTDNEAGAFSSLPEQICDDIAGRPDWSSGCTLLSLWLVLVGLGVFGRGYYGAYPLEGKLLLLGTRDNKKIIGLIFKKKLQVYLSIDNKKINWLYSQNYKAYQATNAMWSWECSPAASVRKLDTTTLVQG